MLFVFVGTVVVRNWWTLRKLKRVSRDYSKTLPTGIILEPGQSAYADFQLPSEIQELVKAGGRLEFKQGPQVHDGNGSYHRDLGIFVDDVKQGYLRAQWKLWQ